MAVDPFAAQGLVEFVKSLPDDYSFGDWLESTRRLQIIAFGHDPAENVDDDHFAEPDQGEFDPGPGGEWFFVWNAFGAITEIVEMSQEVGWKPWATDRSVNREALIREAVDKLHFAANILTMVSCTGEELTAAYKTKQLKNLQRQIDGYTGTNKCAHCQCAFDDLPDAKPYHCGLPNCPAGDKLVCTMTCHDLIVAQAKEDDDHTS